MRAPDLRRLLVGLLVVAVGASALSGCVPPAAPSAPELDGVSVEQAFAEHGIAMIEDAGEMWPSTAFMASPASAIEVMQAELEGSGGLRGADLDELVPMPAGSPPFSFIVSAWLSDAGTARSSTARAWFGADAAEIDWSRAQSLAYPRAALILFVADAMEASIEDFGVTAAGVVGPAAPAAPGTHLAGLSSGTAPAALPAAPCSTVANFFGEIINRIFSAIQLPPDFLAQGGVLGKLSGFLAKLFNTAVELAKRALVTVINALTAHVIRAIAAGVAIVGVISHLSSYVLGVSMVMVPSENPIPLAGQSGDWRAVMNSNRPLEAQLNDCLAALGQAPLPDIVKTGENVSWVAYPARKANGGFYEGVPLAYPDAFAVTVGPNSSIVVPWTAITEQASGAPQELGRLEVKAEVLKGDVSNLLAIAQQLVNDAIDRAAALTGPLAAEASSQIRRILLPILDRLQMEIIGAGRSFLVLVGHGHANFLYRAPDDPVPPPGAPIPNCYLGEWRFVSMESRWLDLSRSAFQRFTLAISPGGRYQLRVGGWATYRPEVGGFWVSYEGWTRFDASPAPNGVWVAKTSNRLNTIESYAALYMYLGNGYVFGGDESVGAMPYTGDVVDRSLFENVDEIRAYDDYTSRTPGAVGEAVFGAGLRPTQLVCSDDGATLSVTGEADPNYGPAVWHFRRI